MSCIFRVEQSCGECRMCHKDEKEQASTETAKERNMRLIDAEYFKECITLAYLKNDINADSGIALLELIDSVPTAYDVDNVVEQLLGNHEDIRANPRQSTINLEEAIRIVKAGRVNE